MTDEIVWEDPPTPKQGGGVKGGVWAERLAPLRERPGQWARFGSVHSATAVKIRRGYVVGISDGEFESTLRNVVNGKGDLYVRFVGKPDLKDVAS